FRTFVNRAKHDKPFISIIDHLGHFVLIQLTLIKIDAKSLISPQENLLCFGAEYNMTALFSANALSVRHRVY
uniref:hypothetical protein n=1 Tax=Klebsiella quasipneumoniae TaxID=1463165 RepID=UPI0015A753A1